MATKSGYSHALAALLSLLIGRLLVSYLQPYFPVIFEPLEKVTVKFEGWIENLLGVELTSEIFVPVIVAVAIAFLWGLIYHYVRHGGPSGK